jgi:uncharacterized coiled-coil protein SlyX
LVGAADRIEDRKKEGLRMPQSHSQLNMARIVALSDQLRLVCRKVDDTAVYEEGWDDARVARECGVTVHNVYGVRTATIGSLRKSKTVAAEAKLAQIEAKLASQDRFLESLVGQQARLAQIEAKLAILENHVDLLHDRTSALEDWAMARPVHPFKIFAQAKPGPASPPAPHGGQSTLPANARTVRP